MLSEKEWGMNYSTANVASLDINILVTDPPLSVIW